MQRILFVELLGGIGDLLIALPAIQALGYSHPEAELDVLTFQSGAPLLAHDPLIDRVYEADKDHASETVAGLLEDTSYDLVVSDTMYENIDRIIARNTSGRTVTNLWHSPPDDQRIAERFLAILQSENLIASGAVPEARLHVASENRAKAREQLGCFGRPLIWMFTDAGMSIKQWPAENYIRLSRMLTCHYGADVIFPVGSNPDTVEHIVRTIGAGASMWPQGALELLAAGMDLADVVIGPDTGPVHIAPLLDVPTVMLFGPSWHQRYGEPDPHQNLQGYPECSERNISDFTRQECWYGGACPFDRWKTCLEDITPEKVFVRVEHLLKDRKRGPSVTVPAEDSSDAVADWSDVERLLVMRLDNIGDVLMTSPALRTIKEHLPEVHLTLMASPAGAKAAPLLPWVDEVIERRVLWQELEPAGVHVDEEWALIQELQRHAFDGVIMFTSFSQSPHPPGFISWMVGIPRRLGTSVERDPHTLTVHADPPSEAVHQVERNLRLLEAIGLSTCDDRLSVHIPPESGTAVDRLMAEYGMVAGEPFILLNPWTSAEARNYSWKGFARAGRRLAGETGWPVVVTGTAQHRAQVRPLMDALTPYGIDLVGETSVPELAALVERARLMLTNNTATMHLGDAAGTPSVVLFAGTERESQWRPRYGPARVLRRPTACSPCYGFTCPYNKECLDIPVRAVVRAALGLLKDTDHHRKTTEAVGLPGGAQ